MPATSVGTLIWLSSIISHSKSVFYRRRSRNFPTLHYLSTENMAMRIFSVTIVRREVSQRCASSEAPKDCIEKIPIITGSNALDSFTIRKVWFQKLPTPSDISWRRWAACISSPFWCRITEDYKIKQEMTDYLKRVSSSLRKHPEPIPCSKWLSR